MKFILTYLMCVVVSCYKVLEFNSRNLIINKTLVQSIDGNILTIVNHNFIKGQKVLFNSFIAVCSGAEDSMFWC